MTETGANTEKLWGLGKEKELLTLDLVEAFHQRGFRNSRAFKFALQIAYVKTICCRLATIFSNKNVTIVMTRA